MGVQHVRLGDVSDRFAEGVITVAGGVARGVTKEEAVVGAVGAVVPQPAAAASPPAAASST